VDKNLFFMFVLILIFVLVSVYHYAAGIAYILLINCSLSFLLLFPPASKNEQQCKRVTQDLGEFKYSSCYLLIINSSNNRKERPFCCYIIWKMSFQHDNVKEPSRHQNSGS